MSEFFQFSRDIFNLRFFIALAAIGGLALFLPKKWTQPFRSVRLNVILFLIIAGASALGTFIPQNQQDSHSWAVLETLGFYDLYHSWWFAGLLALMCFNVLVCKLDRLPKVVMGPPRDEQGPVRGSVASLLSRAKIRRQVLSAKSMEETQNALLDWARRQGMEMEVYPARVTEPEDAPPDAKILFAGKHGVQRWGDFLLHVSIVGILAGGLLGAMVGFEESIPVEEKNSAPLASRDWTITLNDFDIQRYETTGAPSLYASDIEVKKGNLTLGKKRIVVNDPLDIDGVRFYQASWGMTRSFHSVRIFINGKFVNAGEREIVSIPGSDYALRVNEILPSFDVNHENRVLNRNFEGENLALQIDFFQNERLTGRVWVPKDQPDRSYKIVGDRVEPTAPPPFRIVSVDPILFSGIQVGYDPGAPLFWVGSLFLLAGLCLHFYWHHRRFRLIFFEKDNAVLIEAGAWSSRPIQDFRSQFDGMMNDLSRVLR